LRLRDPCAALGVQRAFRRKPDLARGPAANTDSAADLANKLCGVRALNLMRRSARPELVALLNERLAAFD
jgi:hypothetical protein